ncbi:MAG TPA: cell division protein FtsZ, partial [Plasticicumulans sp.]|nr:cell division protein FtsZ [Plasticicumulans sp.]
GAAPADRPIARGSERPVPVAAPAAAAARPAPATPDPFGERSEQDLEYLDIPAFLRRQAD